MPAACALSLSISVSSLDLNRALDDLCLLSISLSVSSLDLNRPLTTCALSFPLCFLSRSESGPGDDLRAAGSLGARIPPARAATANSRARVALPRARFQPRTSPRGARLDENRRLARLGDDSRRHTRELTGALDATVFFPPG